MAPGNSALRELRDQLRAAVRRLVRAVLSMPRSKRCEASVCRALPARGAPDPAGSNMAALSRTRVCRLADLAGLPAITPARATGSRHPRSPDRRESFRLLAVEGRQGARPPARGARRCGGRQACRDRTHAGMPHSSSARLVASTTLLIGRIRVAQPALDKAKAARRAVTSRTRLRVRDDKRAGSSPFRQRLRGGNAPDQQRGGRDQSRAARAGASLHGSISTSLPAAASSCAARGRASP